jgi:hypothetical protein
VNAYGQICSNILVQEIKVDSSKHHHYNHHNSYQKEEGEEEEEEETTSKIMNTINSDQDLSNIITDNYNENDRVGEDNSLIKEAAMSEDTKDGNSLDSKDKRRHYLMKTKEFLHLGKILISYLSSLYYRVIFEKVSTLNINKNVML